MNEKRGISLITLIITIIVIIILAGAIILSLNNTNIIGNANRAVYDQDRESLIDTYTMLTMDKFVANSTKDEPIGNIDISELYTKIGKDLGDKFKVENNNLLEKQEDGSYDIIAKFPNSGSNGESTPVEPSKPEVGKEAPKPSGWGENNYITPTYVKNGNEFAVIPVPKGFVVSKVDTENDIKKGVVIYEGTTDVTSSNQTTAMETRNQFVWVPVPDFSKYKRIKYNKIENSLTIDYSKTAINETVLPSYVSQDVLGATEKRENDAVKKYGGFYIGRYEAGKENTNTLVSKQNKEVYTNIAYKAYDSKAEDDAIRKSKELVNIGEEVKSGLITGVQWDAALSFIETNYPQYATNSTGKGNYEENENLNSWKGVKTVSGKIPEYSVNNIYDMAGNCWEWTNENDHDSMRIQRGGGAFSGNGGLGIPAGYRSSLNETFSVGNLVSFRVSLYIK